MGAFAIPVEAQPQKPAATAPKSETDPRYHSLELPSKFQWYPFKSLSVRPLNVQEIKKIYAAHKSGSLRTFYEAIAPAMDQPVFDLTVGDVYAVLYWLRINSYPKTQYLVKYSCKDDLHMDRVLGPIPEDFTDLLDDKGKPLTKDNYRLSAETLTNEVIVTTSNLSIVEMKSLEEIAQFCESMELCKKGVAFYPSIVRDLIEVDEMSNDPSFDPGDDFLCRLASYLDRRHGISLQERYEFMIKNEEIFTPEAVLEMDDLIEELVHGVRESITCKCKGCGASNEVLVPIDALTFLPQLQRE